MNLNNQLNVRHIAVTAILVFSAQLGAPRVQAQPFEHEQRFPFEAASQANPPGQLSAVRFGLETAFDGEFLLVAKSNPTDVFCYRYIENQEMTDERWSFVSRFGDIPGVEMDVRSPWASIDALSMDEHRAVVVSEFYIQLFELENDEWILKATFDPGGQPDNPYVTAASIRDSLIVVGGWRFREAPSGILRGAAWIYSCNGGIWDVQGHRVFSDQSIEGIRFGESVATDGTNVFVGAPQDVVGANQEGAGAFYQFTRQGENWHSTRHTLEDVIDNYVPKPSDRFGASISTDNTRLAVSALGLQAVVVYTIDESELVMQAIIHPPASMQDAGSAFGHRVVISGDQLLVRGQRQVYLYKWIDEQWTHQETFIADSGKTEFARHGGLALAGEHIVVGNPADAALGSSAGVVYLFPEDRSNTPFARFLYEVEQVLEDGSVTDEEVSILDNLRSETELNAEDEARVYRQLIVHAIRGALIDDRFSSTELDALRDLSANLEAIGWVTTP